MMIKRKTYIQKIRPFFDTDLIKVITGVRRCGKSVMLDLIKEELLSRGVQKEQFISINFEDIDYEKYREYHKKGNRSFDRRKRGYRPEPEP